jgi:hypothetical protein
MPRSRRVRTALVGALALVAVVVAAVIALRPPPHQACRNFPFTPPEWRAADGARRETLARLIVRCHTLSRRTLAEARRILGPAEVDGNGRWSWRLDTTALHYTLLEVTLGPDGRVSGARIALGTF